MQTTEALKPPCKVVNLNASNYNSDVMLEIFHTCLELQSYTSHSNSSVNLHNYIF